MDPFQDSKMDPERQYVHRAKIFITFAKVRYCFVLLLDRVPSNYMLFRTYKPISRPYTIQFNQNLWAAACLKAAQVNLTLGQS